MGGTAGAQELPPNLPASSNRTEERRRLAPGWHRLAPSEPLPGACVRQGARGPTVPRAARSHLGLLSSPTSTRVCARSAQRDGSAAAGCPPQGRVPGVRLRGARSQQVPASGEHRPRCPGPGGRPAACLHRPGLGRAVLRPQSYDSASARALLAPAKPLPG